MKKLIINNVSWFVDMATGLAYEYEDKTGGCFHVTEYSHISKSEAKQIKDQLTYLAPMISY